MKLAEIYEILNEPRKALDLVMQGSRPLPLDLLQTVTCGLYSDRFPKTPRRATRRYG